MKSQKNKNNNAPLEMFYPFCIACTRALHLIENQDSRTAAKGDKEHQLTSIYYSIFQNTIFFYFHSFNFSQAGETRFIKSCLVCKWYVLHQVGKYEVLGLSYIAFGYSEKATKFEKIFHLKVLYGVASNF